MIDDKSVEEILFRFRHTMLLCEYLEKKGVKFIRPVGPNHPGRKDLVACIEDPDAYKVELNESYKSTAFERREPC